MFMHSLNSPQHIHIHNLHGHLLPWLTSSTVFTNHTRLCRKTAKYLGLSLGSEARTPLGHLSALRGSDSIKSEPRSQVRAGSEPRIASEPRIRLLRVVQ
jgi:hypothetical protein